VVVDHLGTIIRLTIGKGHNNDQGMFLLNKMTDWIKRLDLSPLAADLGYNGEGTVRPLVSEALSINRMPCLVLNFFIEIKYKIWSNDPVYIQ
jgi:hypothetical protein